MERDELSSRLKTLQGDLTAKDKQLGERQGEIQRLLQQTSKFRDIFLDTAGDQKISDDEIIRVFLRVRQSTLSVAKSNVLCVDQRPMLEGDASQQAKVFYGNGKWESWEHKDRELHVRKELFEMLHHYILDTACFGIEGCQSALPEGLGPIANGLRGLEAMAKNQRGEFEAYQA